MKFDCGLTRKNRIKAARLQRIADAEKAERTWIRNFCWWPKQLGDNDCRWLEFIEKRPRYEYHCLSSGDKWDVKRIWTWEYRAIE